MASLEEGAGRGSQETSAARVLVPLSVAAVLGKKFWASTENPVNPAEPVSPSKVNMAQQASPVTKKKKNRDSDRSATGHQQEHQVSQSGRPLLVARANAAGFKEQVAMRSRARGLAPQTLFPPRR